MRPDPLHLCIIFLLILRLPILNVGTQIHKIPLKVTLVAIYKANRSLYTSAKKTPLKTLLQAHSQDHQNQSHLYGQRTFCLKGFLRTPYNCLPTQGALTTILDNALLRIRPFCKILLIAIDAACCRCSHLKVAQQHRF